MMILPETLGLGKSSKFHQTWKIKGIFKTQQYSRKRRFEAKFIKGSSLNFSPSTSHSYYLWQFNKILVLPYNFAYHCFESSDN